MDTNTYVMKLMRLTKDVENLELFRVSLGLSKTEFRLLREVAMEQEKGKDIISSELARRLNITRSAVSQLVGKLEQKGVIVRVPSPVDKKIAYVRLSEETSKMFHDSSKATGAVLRKAIREFGADRTKEMFASYEEFFALLRKYGKDIVIDQEGSIEAEC